MTIDYHVHLEEGPYSFRWLERTSQALEFFYPDDETEKGSKQQITCHLQRLARRLKNACYSEEWLDLYLELKGTRCSQSSDYRQFKAWLGVPPIIAEKIWLLYQDSIMLPNRYLLALVLNYLKVMPVQENGAAEFKISAPTYRKYLWTTIKYLDVVTADQVERGTRYSFKKIKLTH